MHACLLTNALRYAIIQERKMARSREMLVVRELQIEDILATYTDLLGQILGMPVYRCECLRANWSCQMAVDW
jgi:hypothetical protein